jgi:exodeoxyribonuclease VII large subunit
MSHAFDEVKTRLRDARLEANSAAHQLQTLMNQKMRQAGQKTNALAQRISPAQLQARVANARARYDAAAANCTVAIDERLQNGREKFGLAAASLDALSPLAVLHRGYAIAQDANGKLLRDAGDVIAGDLVDVTLAKGKLRTKVEKSDVSDMP